VGPHPPRPTPLYWAPGFRGFGGIAGGGGPGGVGGGGGGAAAESRFKFSKPCANCLTLIRRCRFIRKVVYSTGFPGGEVAFSPEALPAPVADRSGPNPPPRGMPAFPPPDALAPAPAFLRLRTHLVSADYVSSAQRQLARAHAALARAAPSHP
jgi:hypothetical protein